MRTRTVRLGVRRITLPSDDVYAAAAFDYDDLRLSNEFYRVYQSVNCQRGDQFLSRKSR